MAAAGFASSVCAPFPVERNNVIRFISYRQTINPQPSERMTSAINRPGAVKGGPSADPAPAVVGFDEEGFHS